MKVLAVTLLYKLMFASTVLVGGISSSVQEFAHFNYNEEYNKVISLLPENMEVVYKDEENKVPMVEKRDINNDKKEEILVVSKDKNINNAFFLIIFNDVKGNWEVFDTVKGEGYAVDILEFSDIDGDKKDDIIFGLKIGSAYGKVNVYNIINNKINRLFSTTYSKLEIIPKGKYGNETNQSALAILIKDTGEAYKTNIVRWNGKELIEAKDIHKHYYKKLVEYYSAKVKEMPEAAFYWYYLAEAQGKARMKEAALMSIAKGVSLDQGYPTKQQFEELKKSIK